MHIGNECADCNTHDHIVTHRRFSSWVHVALRAQATTVVYWRVQGSHEVGPVNEASAFENDATAATELPLCVGWQFAVVNHDSFRGGGDLSFQFRIAKFHILSIGNQDNISTGET